MIRKHGWLCGIALLCIVLCLCLRHGRTIGDIELTAQLIREHVVRVWGGPFKHWGVEYEAWMLDSGDELRLSFLPEPPYRLYAARLVSITNKQQAVFEGVPPHP